MSSAGRVIFTQISRAKLEGANFTATAFQKKGQRSGVELEESISAFRTIRLVRPTTPPQYHSEKFPRKSRLLAL